MRTGAPDERRPYWLRALRAASTNSAAFRVSAGQSAVWRIFAETRDDPTPRAAHPALIKSPTLCKSTPPVGTNRK